MRYVGMVLMALTTVKGADLIIGNSQSQTFTSEHYEYDRVVMYPHSYLYLSTDNVGVLSIKANTIQISNSAP